MQQRRARHGELGVFGATRYLDGLAAGPVSVREPRGPVIQVKGTDDVKHMEESYRTIQSKSNLATCFGSLLDPAASFHANQPASSSTTPTTPGNHREPPQLITCLSSSPRGSNDIVTAAPAVCVRDLGEVVGDRRLQGVRVVRGASVGEETWVVRCGGGHALEEEEHHVRHKIVGDHQAVDGDDCGSDSDTSSDLFELDLEDANNH